MDDSFLQELHRTAAGNANQRRQTISHVAANQRHRQPEERHCCQTRKPAFAGGLTGSATRVALRAARYLKDRGTEAVS